MPFEELFYGFLICLSVCRFCMKRTLLRGITLASAVAASALGFAGKTAVWLCLAFGLGIWLVLALIAFGFLWAVCKAVDMEKPQEHDDKFYRTVMNIYIEALKTLVGIRFTVTGGEKLPKEGRFLLVCNHLFLADPALLLNAFPKAQLAFVTKQENEKMFVVGPIMHKILCQSLDRDNDRAALKTILKCIQLLKEDQVSIGVFPEGYTSKDCKVHPFRSGVFKIAQKATVPIVVCTIQNTRQIFKNLAKLKKTDVPLHLVDVIPAEDLKGKSTGEIADQVYEMMIADLGEEFRYKEI
jgi:1-acyl-sn-glycerol-3-phosphate acyltransferase